MAANNDFDKLIQQYWFSSTKEEYMPLYPDFGNGILKGKDLEQKKKYFDTIDHNSFPLNFKYRTLQTLQADGSIDYTLIEKTEDDGYKWKPKTPIEYLCNYGCYNAATMQLTLNKIESLSKEEKEKYEVNISCLKESLEAHIYATNGAKTFIESNPRLKFYKQIENSPDWESSTYTFTIDGKFQPKNVHCYISSAIEYAFNIVFDDDNLIDLINKKVHLSLEIDKHGLDPLTEWIEKNLDAYPTETYSAYNIYSTDDFLKVYDWLVSLQAQSISPLLLSEMKLVTLKFSTNEIIEKVKNIVSNYDIKRNEGKPVDLLCERMKYELGIYQRLKKYTAKQLFITEKSHNQQLEDKKKILTQLYNAYQESHLAGLSLTPDEKRIQDFQENIWKNGFNYVYLQQLDDIINDIEDGKIQTKFNGLSRYGKPCDNRITIGAAIITRGKISTDRTPSTNNRDAQETSTRKARIKQQIALLTNFAKLSDCWITDFYEKEGDYLRLYGKKYYYLDKGSDNSVYDSGDEIKDENEKRKVIKIIDIPEDWKHIFYNDISEIFERIVIHNCLFSDSTLNLLGFTNSNGDLKVIVEQLFFKGEVPTFTEIIDYITNKVEGVHPILDFFHNSDILIGDLHERNVIKTPKNNIIVIDCILTFKENGLFGLSSTPNAKPIRLGSIVSEPKKLQFYENLYNQLESIVKDDSFEKNGIRKFILSHIPEDYKNDDIEGIVEVFYHRLRELKCGEKGLGSVSHKFNIGDTIKMPSGVTAKIIGFVDEDKYKIEFDDTVSGRKKIAVYFWKLEENAVLSDDYHVGDLITYKGYEETIFKIVAVKGNRYIVIDLADRTKTKNEIPMSDNDKLQMASFPLLVKEMELLDNFNNLIKDLETELINSKLVYVVKYNKNEEIKPAIAKKIEELMLANINLEKYKLLYKRYAIDNKYRESIVNKVYEDIYDKLLQLANENTKPKPKFKIGDYVIYYLSPKNPLKIRSVRYDGRSYYYGFDKNISNFQNIYEKYLSKSLGNVVEELQPSGLSGFEDEFSKELLVAEMHLLELEKLKDFGEKIGGSAKDRYNGRKIKDKTENEQKTKGFNRLPTMDEMQSFGQECFQTKFKPNVSDFEDFGLNKIVARLCFFHYYGIFDKYAGYNVNSINDLYSLVDDKRIQDTITSYFIENKRHTQNFKTQYFAPDAKVHFYAIDFVYTALSMNLEKDLKDDFDYKNVLKAYNRGNKDWHFYRDKCIFLDKNKNDITEENKQRVFNLAYENAMNDFPLFRVMLTYNNGIIFLAHKDCKENQRTWRPLSQKYAKDLQQDICSAGWQDIYKHYAELYVKGKELYGQQFGFDEPDKWRFKDKEGLFAKVREGKDWRNGRNAEPKDFIDTFGFRAVEFGETMPQKERWEHLNRTFDSFMDLCDILNIKPENISLGGTLALSFGSRGRGGKHAAAAHYEPTKKVINLTRRSGAGCLAHEWFHAFDNQVCDHSYAYGQSCYGTRDAYSGWITNQDVSHYFYLFSNYCSNFNGFNFYKSAVALDYYEKRKEDYWQKKLECGARAFEWYVIKKLTDRQQINEYLAQIPLAEPDRMKLYPYPHPNDYDTIENIFDGIFKNVQQVKTPTGVTIR